ncbi:MAG: ester cyclase [Cyanobacteria bacterium REEB65]|nr:ester cyclase [Cyanobacteria bacterium REEB65]
MSGETTRQIATQLMEAFNRRDARGIDDFLAPNFVEHTPTAGFGATREGLVQWLDGFFRAFPDMTCNIAEVIAEDDRVAIRGTMTGTYQGEKLGSSAAGTPVTIEGVDILHLENGKIRDHWGFYDQEGLAQQLGLEPMPGAVSFLQALAATTASEASR